MAWLEKLPTHLSLQIEPHDRVLEAGRQTKEDPAPPAVIPMADVTRLVIAPRDQSEVGRRQLRIEVLEPRRVRLTNINDNNHLLLPDSRDLGPGESTELSLPTRIIRGGVQINVGIFGEEQLTLPDESDHFQTLANVPRSPNTVYVARRNKPGPMFSATPRSASFVASIRNSDTDEMLDRLEQLVTVLQQAASTADFAEQIARTAIDMVNLDRAAVLVCEGLAWRVAAMQEAQPAGTESWRPSQKLLDQLRSDRRTFWWQPSSTTDSPSASFAILLAVVAAPILNAKGEVAGAVYGDRRVGGNSGRSPIDHFDAKMVEIMACGVAAGWARLEHEQQAVARRIQLERFVTKEVARRLEEDPDALLGRDAEATMLFCDIAGFSRISEMLSPTATFDWINAVMEALSECVLATGGTLVDYVGDELIAMWGAPLSMPNHAAAAAKTAMLMRDAITALNERRLLPDGQTTQVGIGLNSGEVRVGNTGSAHKLKYGPLGSDVNIASRVQGATRYLRTPVLITGATAKQLDGDFRTRRLCAVRLKNIEQPIELFELVSNPEESWIQLALDYENALSAWERRDLHSAIGMLSHLVARNSSDGPTMVLLSRAVDAWSRDQREYDPVWTLPSK